MRLIHFVIHGPCLAGERQDLWSQVLECGLLSRWVPLILSHGSSVRIYQCGSRGVWDFTPRNVVWGWGVQLYRAVTHSWTPQTRPSRCMREGRLTWNCVVMIKCMLLPNPGFFLTSLGRQGEGKSSRTLSFLLEFWVFPWDFWIFLQFHCHILINYL